MLLPSPRDKLEALERWVQGGFQPDLTVLFDVPPDTASERRSSAREPDRFSDATFAYQGGGRGLPRDKLEALERWVQGGFQPDLTLLFDVPPDTASERRSSAREPDRFESESDAFFTRTRAEYLRRAEEAPYRFAIIDSSQSIPLIQKRLEELISTL